MKCEPGDIAVIINGGDFPENVGAFVTVIEASAKFPGQWIVKPRHKLRCSFFGLMQESAAYGAIPDFALQPIRGLPVSETTKQSEKVPA